jgi:exodeoxyribonuclease VII small subunit
LQVDTTTDSCSFASAKLRIAVKALIPPEAQRLTAARAASTRRASDREHRAGMADKTAAAVAELSFEDALARLEQIVHQLEAGEAPLEASIDLYSEGQQLKAHCEAKLKSAQARIEQLQIGPGGEPTGRRPFATDD